MPASAGPQIGLAFGSCQVPQNFGV